MRFRLGACEVVKRCVVGSTERVAEIFGTDCVSIFFLWFGWDRSKFRGPGVCLVRFNICLPQVNSYDIIERLGG